MLKIAFSPIYRYELPQGHRFPMDKYDLLPEQLLYEGTIAEDNLFAPKRASDELIHLTHDIEYWSRLKNLALTTKEIRKIGFPLRKELVERGRYIAHGTLECAYYAAQYGVAMNIAGGTHHSFRDRGEGFCLLNDIAIAANQLLKEGKYNRILIVDLDVHQGNGTAKIFEEEPRVFTFSMHGAKNYPTKKEQSDLDIGMPDKTEDTLYIDTLKQHFPSILESFQPNFVFYLSGVDVLATDKLGRLSMSLEGCKARDKYIINACKKNDLPICISMGGGYSMKLAHIIEAHANTFRVAQDIFF